MANGMRYIGKLSLERLTASVDLSRDRADVTSDYSVRNRARRDLKVNLGVARPGLAGAVIKTTPTVRPTFTRVATPRLESFTRKTLATTLKPQQKHVLHVAYSAPVFGTRSRSFLYVPSLQVNNLELLQPVANYEVSLKLPKNAKKLIGSTIAPTSVQQTGDRIVVTFKKRNAYLLPISVKWTELDVDVSLTKSVRKMGRSAAVVITIKNNKSSNIPKIVVEDCYTAAEAQGISPAGKFRITHPNDKDPRLAYTETFALAGGASKTFTYRVRALDTGLSVPTTVARVSGTPVAMAIGKWVAFPPPAPMPKAAFALPAGWSFDYRHGGDHHLNEHGMWCTSQSYSVPQNRLTWQTGCIYADKNFDDDYRWSVGHQVLRFDPGFANHGQTPWLAKTGSISTHSTSFQHASLKNFSKAIVLLRGWRFDFTNKDHHINKIAIRVVTTGFNRAAGKINWSTQVSYADKNWDDTYRYQYWYTILAFNGAWVAKTFSGKDPGGGTHAHAGSASNALLKNYEHGIVVPVGWSFDYSSKDHHINQNHFKIQNMKYNRHQGKFNWTAHLNYCDKNKDDPYNWKYHVLLLATSQGDSRVYDRGPYNDNGGYASISCTADLNSLFVPITWTNGVRDGNEVGVDCGGSSPAKWQNPCRSSVSPGNAASSNLFSLKKQDDLNTVKTFATVALLEYALHRGQDFGAFYSGPEKPDRYVEAIAWYVHQHMDYVADSGSWKGSQSAFKTLTKSGHRGAKDFAGDCEDHAILRAALLRSLGFYHKCIFCADHHNDKDQGQRTECGYQKKKGGHTYNVVVYRGKYRIMDYGEMRCRFWANQQCWDQHATDNIWNDHTGKHWSKKDVSPYGTQPLVNYPGNPCSPSPNWDWRTYFCDITA